MRVDARLVRERDEGVVVGASTCSQGVQLGVDLGRGPEKLERLVDEVAPEVVEQPAGVLRIPGLAPSAGELGAPALEPRLEARNRAELTGLEERPHGHEVAVPAPVLED